jgi:chaperone modulatory protein CbpM
METSHLIPIQELCIHYKVDISFISRLEEHGLIEIITVEERTFVHPEELVKFEKISRLHNDLEINLEGIEAIHHLLDRVNELQEEIRTLRNKLGSYDIEE